MINKKMNGGFIAKYVFNKVKMQVVIANSVDFVTVSIQVSFISIIGNFNRFIFDILVNWSTHVHESDQILRVGFRRIAMSSDGFRIGSNRIRCRIHGHGTFGSRGSTLWRSESINKLLLVLLDTEKGNEKFYLHFLSANSYMMMCLNQLFEVFSVLYVELLCLSTDFVYSNPRTKDQV